MINNALISQVKNLSVADRIGLMGVVWDTLSPDEMPVSDDEKDLLDARLADMAQNPEKQSLWPEIQARLSGRYLDLQGLCPPCCGAGHGKSSNLVRITANGFSRKILPRAEHSSGSTC